ncbi:phage tail fiber protein, partial [Enterobacter cloacae]
GLGYGSTAGTVAQGNDERLNSVNGKAGGTITGPLTIATGGGFNDKSILKREDGEAAWVAFIANGVIRWRIGMSTSGDSDRFKISGWTSGGGSYVNSLNITQGSIVYTTENTTKSSDGTLKAASPVARIVLSQEACQRADVAEDGFSWCGCGTANAEAEGITISRLDIGVYKLTGSAGLASEGWQLLPPMDPGGMGELGVVEAEQTENGVLTIRLFKRKYMLGDDGEIIKTKGEPMDVPANSWIDVRLDMPDDSLFNQRMSQEPRH